MKFTADQLDALKAPLSRESVRTRQQSGRTLSYVEGWKAIAEANRIFGFDGWTRETVDLKMVAEHERPIGKDGAKGWGVTYIARVRVMVRPADQLVGGVIREGCGTGHGIDRDLGQAHESALKESETDAMKRALMTFGNPFGLALYDKEQNEVEDAPTKPTQREAIHGPSTLKPEPTPHPGKPTMTPQAWAQMGIDRLATFNSKEEINAFEDKYGDKIAKLAESIPDMHKKLVAAIADRHFQLDMQ